MKKTLVNLNTKPLYQQPTNSWLSSNMLTPNGGSR